MRTALAFNAAWAAADAAVPTRLPPHVRDDVISEMVVAQLAGELAASECRRRAPEYVKAYNRMFDSFKTVSLDAPMHGNDDLSLIDVLADDCERF